MTESLRALLSGAIDYAGLFPPAGLPLPPWRQALIPLLASEKRK